MLVLNKEEIAFITEPSLVQMTSSEFQVICPSIISVFYKQQEDRQLKLVIIKTQFPEILIQSLKKQTLFSCLFLTMKISCLIELIYFLICKCHDFSYMYLQYNAPANSHILRPELLYGTNLSNVFDIRNNHHLTVKKAEEVLKAAWPPKARLGDEGMWEISEIPTVK